VFDAPFELLNSLNSGSIFNFASKIFNGIWSYFYSESGQNFDLELEDFEENTGIVKNDYLKITYNKKTDVATHFGADNDLGLEVEYDNLDIVNAVAYLEGNFLNNCGLRLKISPSDLIDYDNNLKKVFPSSYFKQNASEFAIGQDLTLSNYKKKVLPAISYLEALYTKSSCLCDFRRDYFKSEGYSFYRSALGNTVEARSNELHILAAHEILAYCQREGIPLPSDTGKAELDLDAFMKQTNVMFNCIRFAISVININLSIFANHYNHHKSQYVEKIGEVLPQEYFIIKTDLNMTYMLLGELKNVLDETSGDL